MFSQFVEKRTGLQVFGVPSFAAMEIQRSNEGEGTCRTVSFHNLGGDHTGWKPQRSKVFQELRSKV